MSSPATTTLASQMLFQNPFIQTGYTETITQAIDKFNAASGNTITLRTQRKLGDFDYQAFFKNAGGLVSRQDQTSVDPALSKQLSQAEIISVKLNRKIGPVEWSRAAFLKPGLSMDAIQIAAGEQAAKDVLADMLNTGIVAGRVAIQNELENFVDASTANLDTVGLANGLSKFGDQAERIGAFVMHSKVYYDLVKSQITSANGANLAFAVVQSGAPVSLNRPIIVTDSDALFDGTSYYTLGLTQSAIIVEETEEMFMQMMPITGLEQLVMRMQGEFAYNLGVKGFSYNAATGGKNPDYATVSAGANWTKTMTSHKDLAGLVIKSK